MSQLPELAQLESAELPLFQKIGALWEQIRAHDLSEYQDDEWCEDLDAERYILEVLSWNHHREGPRSTERDRVFATLTRLGKRLHALSDDELSELSANYPVQWQRDYLARLVRYLRTSGRTFDELCKALGASGPRLALALLEDLCATDYTNIPACFLREYFRFYVFPIDRRVDGLLRSFGVVPDLWAISEACAKLGIPTRVMARAAYSLADELPPP